MFDDKQHQLCTVLVNSCDAYYDLWRPFFTLFRKFWPDCPYQILLNTESRKYEFEGLNIKCLQHYKPNTRVKYGERLIDSLNSIETPYILMMLDDFFIREKVDQKRISEIISWYTLNPEISCFNFDCIADKLNYDDYKFDGFELRSSHGDYRYNMQLALWSKDALKKAWRKRENPWQWEQYGNMRSWGKDIIYSLKFAAKSPINYGKTQGLTWGVVRGKWAKDDIVPLFAEHDIQIDYSLRGFFEKTNETFTKSNRIEILYSLGPLMFIKYICWYSIRFRNNQEKISFSEYLIK